MQVVTKEFDNDVNILFFSDLHAAENPEILDKVSKVIKETNPTGIISLGDILNGNGRNTLSNPFESEIQPAQELKLVREFFERHAPLIWGAVRGNHEYRMVNKFGTDPMEAVLGLLRIPYDDIIIFDVAINNGRTGSRRRITYALACAHGFAGGRYEEKSTRQGRAFGDFLSGGIDFYVSAHTHVPSWTGTTRQEYNRTLKKITTRTVHYLTLSGLSNGAYARRKLLKPSPPVVLLLNLPRQYKHSNKVAYSIYQL